MSSDTTAKKANELEASGVTATTAPTTTTTTTTGANSEVVRIALQMLAAQRRFDVDGYEHDKIISKQSQINWEKYIGAGRSSNSSSKDENLFVTSRDVDKIKEFQGCPDSAVQEILDTQPESGYGYAQALLKAINNISEQNVLTYTLTLLEDFIIPNVAARSKFFIPNDPTVSANPASLSFDVLPLIRNTQNEDKYIREKSAYLAGIFLALRPSPKESLDSLITWIVEQLRNSQAVAEKALLQSGNSSSSESTSSLQTSSMRKADARLANFAASSSLSNPVTTSLIQGSSLRATLFTINALLRNKTTRAAFAEHGGPKLLFPLLPSTSGSMQLSYELAFSIWTCSFSQECLAYFTPPAFNSIVGTIKSKPREKVLRLCLNSICNAIRGQPSEEKQICDTLIGLDLLRTLETIEGGQKCNDSDVIQDMAWLKDMLLKNFRVLTTFECYEQELATGELKPGPIHEDKFWKEYAKRFEANDFATFRRLIHLLSVSRDPTTLSLACSDVGYFVQFFPQGKKIAQALDAKKKVMNLLTFQNPDVQKNALLACSKMMVNNWEFLKQ